MSSAGHKSLSFNAIKYYDIRKVNKTIWKHTLKNTLILIDFYIKFKNSRNLKIWLFFFFSDFFYKKLYVLNKKKKAVNII